MMTKMKFEVRCGDAREVLSTLPDESVDCVVTSPPYFGLRAYGAGLMEIGGESTPQAYVDKLVGVFTEARRALKRSGTLWIVIGDSYGGKRGNIGEARDNKHPNCVGQSPGNGKGDTERKQLMGIPWRLAFALQDSGWWLRQDIIWAKPAPMPESVRDRCTRSHEYVFLLTKSAKYWFDQDAIKEPAVCGDPYGRGQVDARGNGHDRGGGNIRATVLRGGFNGKTELMADTGQNAFRSIKDWRNKRDVWTVGSEPSGEAHFAMFPEKLIEPMILAGCPPGGLVVDPFCGGGRTLAVAIRHGRRAMGIDLNPQYCELSRQRVFGEFPELRSEVLEAMRG